MRIIKTSAAGGGVKSVQRGVAGSFSSPISIGAVNPANSIVLASTGTAMNGRAWGEVINANQIMLHGKAYGSAAWQVIEFDNVASVQTGLIALDQGVKYRSINVQAVNLERSVLFTEHEYTQYSAEAACVRMLDEDTIRVERSANNPSGYSEESFTLVEFP